MRPTLILTRGLPASGKTTWARQWVACDPLTRARVNRDDLRQSLFDCDGVLSHQMERQVSTAQRAAVRALLASGSSVVVDDTNLRAKFAREWADLAVDAGADLEVMDFVDVPLSVCIERDAARIAAGGP